MNLATLGWDDFFAHHFAPHAEQDVVPGRVAVEYNYIYRVYTATSERRAQVSGRLKYEAKGRQDLPAVGDWVAVRVTAAASPGLIERVLPRKTKFSRKVAGETTEEQVVAANVDTVLLVSALDAEFNLRRIERYLVLARESGARPVVVLNKADLAADPEARAAEVRRLAPDVPVHVMSVRQSMGLDAIRPYLARGQTVALLGSSGVGKTTIINRLVGRDIRKTAEVRARDRRGRHTTMHRELIVLPEGGLIIDTPGMRELQLWDVGQGVQETFGDIERLAARCRFRDCTHAHEPGCAVRAAVDQGELAPGRLESYLKLRGEARYLETRRDERAEAEQKRKWKVIHKAQRDLYKSRKS